MMTRQEKIKFKNKLKQACRAIIEQRIEAVKLAIDNAQQAANQEEKSSVGDKYETSRAMNHLEKDMHTRRLGENMKELAALHSIDTNTIYETGNAGAFLQCQEISFFIAAGLGKQTFESKTVFFLSLNAPLARSLRNKKAGDSLHFNNTPVTIIDVY